MLFICSNLLFKSWTWLLSSTFFISCSICLELERYWWRLNWLFISYMFWVTTFIKMFHYQCWFTMHTLYYQWAYKYRMEKSRMKQYNTTVPNKSHSSFMNTNILCKKPLLHKLHTTSRVTQHGIKECQEFYVWQEHLEWHIIHIWSRNVYFELNLHWCVCPESMNWSCSSASFKTIFL